MTFIIRRHILIYPNFNPSSFPAIATKLGCEEIHLFEDDQQNITRWNAAAGTIRSFLHIHEIGGSISTKSSIIIRNVEGLIEKNSLIAISLDSKQPLFVLDAIWQTIVELTSLHKTSDSLGRLDESITSILYSLDQESGSLLTRPIYPFWNFRFLSVVQAMKVLSDGGTKKDMLDILDDYGIPFTIDKITKVLLPLQNWLGEFEGFFQDSCKINGKRTNFYKLKEILEYKLR